MRTPWLNGDWRRVLVYGLGVSGLAATRLLRRHGVAVVGVDSKRPEELGLDEVMDDPGVHLVLGGDPQVLPGGLDGIVVSPGVPLDRPLLVAARQRGLPVIAEVELAFHFLDGPVVAITGSNGKSTTTALAAALLRGTGMRVELCGNIGDALSARVEGPPGRIFVVELSSFQLECIVHFRPRAAALLNLAPDHLDRHVDFAHYAAAKESIFARQRPEDLAVLNVDDPRVAEIRCRSRRRHFSLEREVADGCFLEDGTAFEVSPGRAPEPLFERRDLALPGRHNVENALAACLLALEFTDDREQLRKGLRGFRGLPHRMERVAELDGVRWINDSKATNTAAARRALEELRDGTVHLILGGRAKGTDPAELAEAAGRKARRVYLIGEAAGAFARTLAGVVPCDTVGTLEGAVRAAAAHARPGDTVLLSPACASFDQYRGFAERGEHFRRLVTDLVGGAHGQEAGL